MKQITELIMSNQSQIIQILDHPGHFYSFYDIFHQDGLKDEWFVTG